MRSADQTLDIQSLIRQKLEQLKKFLRVAQPRKRLLINMTIVGGSLAAALTAGPAFGGQSFTAWLTKILGLTSPSWRMLCGASTVCSVAATVASQLLKSHNTEEHVVKAQAWRAKLEVLDATLSFGQIDKQQATSEYLKCVEDVAFLEESK